MELMVPALYIDPGIGFLGLQALAGVFVGASFYFRRTIARVFGRFRPGRHTYDDEPTPPATADGNDA